MTKRAELRAEWSKRECDIVYHYDRRPEDGNMLHSLLNYGMAFVGLQPGEPTSLHTTMSSAEALRRFRATLEARGYDPDTFRISVRRKRATPAPSPATDPGSHG